MNEQKISKVQEFKFRKILSQIVLTTLIGTLHFREWIWCALSEMSFEIFTPIWPRDNENEQTKIVKNPKFEISQFFELW